MEFAQRLSKIADAGCELKPSQLCFLADLNSEDRQQLKLVWPAISTGRRRKIICDLLEIGEDNVEFDFCAVFLNALDDTDETIRAKAIDGLWENESKVVLHRLFDLMRHDPSPLVRAAAAVSMSKFAYKAALGDLDDRWVDKIKIALLSILRSNDEPADVRRRALEAVSYFDDPAVHDLLAEAYKSSDQKMKASAIFGMGHTLDASWTDIVLSELDNPAPEIRYEAARASGELADQRSVPPLLKLLDDPDVEVRLAAIASLGQVGGRRAAEGLSKCLQTENDATREAAEDALAELQFNANPLNVSAYSRPSSP
jgi:HEAT repeat protein